MSTDSPVKPPASEPGPAAQGSPLVSLWRWCAHRRVPLLLLVLAVGVGLMVARAATYSKARAAGFERGRAVALEELESRMTQNDSVRHEGELAALLTLRNVRNFYLWRRSKGWCFLKYVDSTSPNWSTGWVADMRFMERGSEYALARDGTVWNHRRY